MRLRHHEAYDSCDTLPLWNFVKAMTTNDLKYIVKFGKPKNLEETWEKITSEYSNLSSEGDNTNRMLLDTVKDITYLQNKIYLIAITVREFRKSYNSEYGEILNNMGFTFVYTDDADLERKLTLTVNQAKQLEIELDQRKVELKKLQKDDAGELSEGEFDVQLAIYGEFMGAALNPRILTVAEFVGIKTDFRNIPQPLKKLQTPLTASQPRKNARLIPN